VLKFVLYPDFTPTSTILIPVMFDNCLYSASCTEHSTLKSVSGIDFSSYSFTSIAEIKSFIMSLGFLNSMAVETWVRLAFAQFLTP